MDYQRYSEIRQFEEGLKTLNIKMNDHQLQQFIDYYELLAERNKVINLTTITDLSEVITKHFMDSLSIVRVAKLTQQKIIDIGTGAGFPGIPLKIAFPKLDILLLDSLNKRLLFLEEVIEKLGLDRIRTLHGRAEDYGRKPDYREKYDLCVSRAVAKLPSLSEYCLPYVKKGGLFISYKSGKAEEELSEAEHAIKLLGAGMATTDRFILPGTNMERVLIILKKTENTPKAYPRSAGKPSKEPL